MGIGPESHSKLTMAAGNSSPSDRMLEVGEKVLVDVGRAPDGSLNAYFIDFERATPILWLAITFVGFVLLVSGWQGLRGLVGMVASLAVISTVHYPRSSAGWVIQSGFSVAGSFVLAGCIAVLDLWLGLEDSRCRCWG